MQSSRRQTKCLILVLLVGFVFLYGACSYTTDFAILNESDQPIEVRYKVKDFPGPFTAPVAPATVAIPQLSPKGNQQWNTLPADRYHLDQENRTVVVRVMPSEALLVADMHNYNGHGDAWGAREFPIEEITIRGAGRETNLVGTQARTKFSEMSRALYTLTYK